MVDVSRLRRLCPVELQLLKAECENSKLQVRLDTLECHKSIVELDVVCQEETLRKKKRENSELLKYKNGLEEKLQVSGSQLEDVENRLREAHKTVEDERSKMKEEKKHLEEDRAEISNTLQEKEKEWLKEKRELEEKINCLQDGKVKYVKERKDLEAEKTGISKILQKRELEWSKEKKEFEDKIKYLQEKLQVSGSQLEGVENRLREAHKTVEDERLKIKEERKHLEEDRAEISNTLQEKEKEWLKEKRELEEKINCLQEKQAVAIEKLNKTQAEGEQRKKRLKQKGTQATLETVDATTSTSAIGVPTGHLLVDVAVQVDGTTALRADNTGRENVPHSRAAAVCELSVQVERVNPSEFKVLATPCIKHRDEQQSNSRNRKQKNPKRSRQELVCGEDNRSDNDKKVSGGEVLPKKKKSKCSSGMEKASRDYGQEKLLAPKSSDRQPKHGKRSIDQKCIGSEYEESENRVQKKRPRNSTVSKSSQDDGLPCDDRNERRNVACERDPSGSDTNSHASPTGPRGKGRPDKRDDWSPTQAPGEKSHSNRLDDMQIQRSDKSVSENVKATNKVSDLTPAETGLIFNGVESTVNRPSKRPRKTPKKNAKITDSSRDPGKKETSSRGTRAPVELSPDACLDNSTSTLRQNGELITVSQQDSFRNVALPDNEAPALGNGNHAIDVLGMERNDVGTAKPKVIKRGKKKIVGKENPSEEKQEKSSRNKRKSASETSADAAVMKGAVAAGNNMSIVLNGTRKRRMLFNLNDNSLATVSFMPQTSFLNNTTLSRSRMNNTSFSRSRMNNTSFSRSRVNNMPPSLARFMQSFIAPKLKKNTSMSQK